MKIQYIKYLFLWLLQLIAWEIHSQTITENYIKTITPTVATSNINSLTSAQSIRTVQYFDGIGRPMQTIEAKGSTALLANSLEYDIYGRETKSWLPIRVESFNYTSITDNKSQDFYEGETRAYSIMDYEKSPLNRITSKTGPGSTLNKSKNVSYLTNRSSEELTCAYFYTEGTGITITLKRSGNYPDASLYVTKFKDENGNILYEFTNKSGQLILSRQMNTDDRYDTYYVYDHLGNLCYVLPPKLSEAIIEKSAGTHDSATEMAQYAYIYKYNLRNLCTRKKLPGCAAILYGYDGSDRLVFSRHGEQISSNGESLWSFFIPDALGRIVLTGTCADSRDITNSGRLLRAKWEGTTGFYKGYSIVDNWFLDEVTVLTANYYDNYDFLGLNGIPAATHSDIKFETVSGYDAQYANGTKGLVTGTWTSLIDNPSQSLYSVNYYNYHGKIVQKKATNHLNGMDKTWYAYNFLGQPTKKQYEQKIKATDSSQEMTTKEVYNYTYDTAERLTKITHSLNNGRTVTIEENSYDLLGRVYSKSANNNLLSTYEYNIRSWITGIYSPHFTYLLYYNEQPPSINTQVTPCYNGNICAMEYIPTNGRTQISIYKYDNLSRLSSVHNLMTPQIYDGDLRYSYDKNNNMIGIFRCTGEEDLDEILISYNGNQIKTVIDEFGGNPNSNKYDFIDYFPNVSPKPEYIYNKNGALAKDASKGVTFEYDLNNMPRTITVQNPVTDGTISYTFTATGEKLKAVYTTRNVTSGGGLIGTESYKVIHYMGNKIYTDNTLSNQLPTIDKILIPNGYIKGGNYYFYIKDHLGNNRMVIDENKNIIQQTDYFPFGMPRPESTNPETQSYKYNGKEYDMMHKLNMYDYHARQYDPALARFHSIDPLAEKYYFASPYAFCLNNPLKYVDLNGMDSIPVDEVDWTNFDIENDDIELNEIIITGTSNTTFNNRMLYSGYFLGYLSTGMSIYSSGIYQGNRPQIPGYYINSKGKSYPLSIIQPQANGKYIRGVQGHRVGISIAKSKVKIPGLIGQGTAYLATGISGYNLAKNFNLENSVEFGISAASIIYWELGLSYMYTRLIAEPNIDQIKTNIINNQHPLNNTYNPTTGDYYVPGYFSSFGF